MKTPKGAKALPGGYIQRKDETCKEFYKRVMKPNSVPDEEDK